MDWFLRFLLQLPARAEDVQSALTAIPELKTEDFPNEKLLTTFFTLYPFVRTEELLKRLKHWLKSADSPGAEHNSDLNCNIADCPLRKSSQTRSASQRSHDDEEGSFLALWQVAAGGPHRKPPKDSFLDLVRKVHKGHGPIKDVILTDPYVYMDVSEDGLAGGFQNLLSYLDALGLGESDVFKLHTTPSPKRGSKISKINFQRLVKQHFTNIEFKNFSPRLDFHDRLYISINSSGELRGVFGPSLNGLSSPAIVIMGEITNPEPMKTIKHWMR